ncbi:uncharacterized protein LOC115677642 isoform X2 [Syzygium oleosum]|uniref:uncharacterized protein LOC115677642 isoform X2 n=1 Tax=Syzygium oleosum TaxID=219896 RepID=UPI0024B8F117|nr:uncharacterized protein LOC115677642 isoform X2 [Syzygium oleosum]
MEKGKQVMGNGVSGEKAVKKKNLTPYPVEPNSSGKGLPYAPADWPNPGDTWRWWVGKRTTSSGFYKDRVVRIPKRLRAYGVKRTYSKSSLERYISVQFPDADIDEFFASFSWMIPSTEHRWSEDLLSKVPLVASKRNKEAPWNSKMMKKARPATSQAFPRRSTRQSKKIPAQNNTRSEESVIDLCYLTDDSTSDGSGYSKCGSEPQIDLEDVAPDQSIGSSCYASKDFEAQDVQNVQEPYAQFCEEDVDDFLKSVEHILSQHNDEAQVRTPSTCVGSDIAEEMSTHRKKLSSILALDFSCMLSSEYLEQITFLVEKLMADPILTVDQLLKLKLVEEIPKAGKVFQRTKGLADQASNFFGELQAMKDKVSSIKREFSELKKGAGELQSQIDSKSSLVREIDEQIVQLQSRKAELTHDLKSTNEAKVQVVAEQKIMANSISAVMREIQTASAEIPVWEMKKKNAEKRMAEILARYAPLKGLSFEKSG